MKKLLTFSTMIFLLLPGACGKKANIEENSTEKSISPTLAEVHFNVLKEIKRAVLENDLPSLKKSIQNDPGVDLNQILSDSGETFLTTAIKKDFRSIRNYLIEKGVSVEKSNVNKETPLIAAVVSGKSNSVKVLLDLKVDLEKRDLNGDTALHIALKKSNDELAMILIKQGASVHAMDRRDRNAFRIAQDQNLKESLDLIRSIMEMEFGAPDISSYRTILLQADHKRLTNVLNRYPKIATDKAYQSINPLALLVSVKDERNAIRSAELLINNNANVNGPENAEETPLIKATLSKKKGFANLYLTSNANPQLMDKDGKSALIHAVELNDPELVELLLAFSAAERYSFRKDGERISYNACDIARKTGKKLTDAEDISANVRIRKSLDCTFLSWFF